MPDLKILYVAGFDLGRNTGRNKATREKVAALAGLLAPGAMKLISPGSSPVKAIRYLKRLCFDFRMIAVFLRLPGDTVVVERQAFLPLANTLLRLRRIRMVYEVHADPVNEIPLLHKNLPERVILRMLAGIERYNLRQASGIIYNHPNRQAQLSAKFSRPSIVFYSGANVSDFVPGDLRSSRARLSLDPSATYFLFLGMVSPWHGVDLLVNTFRQPALQRFHLLVVGAGKNPYNEALKEQALGCRNIAFIDHTSVAESACYINASDVCLLPVNDIRNSPGSPLKLYDYIACGKPVIAQAGVPGYSDEVLNHRLGIVTDFRDPATAARDLAAFVRQANMEEYRRHNRMMAETALSWRTRMQAWIDFFRSGLAPRKERSTDASF